MHNYFVLIRGGRWAGTGSTFRHAGKGDARSADRADCGALRNKDPLISPTASEGGGGADGSDACLAPPGPAYGVAGAAGRGADLEGAAPAQGTSPPTDSARPAKLLHGEGCGAAGDDEDGEDEGEGDGAGYRCCPKAAAGAVRDGGSSQAPAAGCLAAAGGGRGRFPASCGPCLPQHPGTYGGGGGGGACGLVDVKPLLPALEQDWARKGPAGAAGACVGDGRPGSSRLPALIEAIAAEGRALRWDAGARWYEVLNGPLFEDRCARALCAGGARGIPG